MRYGPIDMTPFGAALDAADWLYWLLVFAIAVRAWRGATTRRQRVVRLSIVIMIFGTLPVIDLIATAHMQHQLNQSAALFKENCRRAGERIFRTASGVDGVVWIRWRDRSLNLSDQFKLDDPFGRDCGGEACIADLLRITKGLEHLPSLPNLADRSQAGFGYVETVDPSDGRQYRYRAVIKVVHLRTAEQLEAVRRNTGRDGDREMYGFALERELIDSYTARYGITWEDISSRRDREHWIAGGALRIVDIKTDEILGERLGYMRDPGLGSTADQRSPWSFAQYVACPSRIDSKGKRSTLEHSIPFARRVLKLEAQGE